jgi:hypothetical protein
VFSPLLVNAGGTGGAQIELDLEASISTANLFYYFAFFVVLGNALLIGDEEQLGFSFKQLTDRVRGSSHLPQIAALLAFLVLSLNLAVRGVSWIFVRDERFLNESSQILSLLSVLTIIAVVAIGVASVSSSSIVRVSAFILGLGYLLLYLSLATRTLALMPLLLLLGAFLGGASKNLRKHSIFAVGMSLVLSPLPLHFRDQAQHGIGPHINSLSTFSFSPDTILKSINNVISGFQIVGTTAFQEPRIPGSYFWISLNPEFGNSAGWYEIAPTLRLNYFTPYGALGEVGNQGWIVALIFAFCLGLIFGVIQKIGAFLLANSRVGGFHMVSLGITFIFIVQFTQYNLRSEVRLLYYALVADISLLLLISYQKRKESKLSPLTMSHKRE